MKLARWWLILIDSSRWEDTAHHSRESEVTGHTGSAVKHANKQNRKVDAGTPLISLYFMQSETMDS